MGRFHPGLMHVQRVWKRWRYVEEGVQTMHGIRLQWDHEWRRVLWQGLGVLITPLSSVVSIVLRIIDQSG